MPVRLFSSMVAALLALAQVALHAPQSELSASSKSPSIVIGFVGGFIGSNNQIHSGVQIAQHLQKDYPSGVYVKVFENHRGEEAHREILKLLDTDNDGRLSLEDKKNARIIIYGHSWGGSETITLAHKLQEDGIPVALTIQVDSVAKRGQQDSAIPANVAQAANFYQTNGWLHGQSKIHAQDPSHTQIIENLRLDYAAKPVVCDGYAWYARAFEGPHIEIECDPNVTSRVESLIRSKLSSAAPPSPEGSDSQHGES